MMQGYESSCVILIRTLQDQSRIISDELVRLKKNAKCEQWILT